MNQFAKIAKLLSMITNASERTEEEENGAEALLEFRISNEEIFDIIEAISEYFLKRILIKICNILK